MKVTQKEFLRLLEVLKNRPDELRLALRHIFKDPENIIHFAKFFYPHILTNDVPAFHKEWYEMYLNDKYEAMAGPRGHAKSTTIGLVGVTFDIVNNREQYILYVSQNHLKSTKFLEPIKAEFNENIKLRWVYGDLTPKATRDEAGKNREDCFDVNGIRIEAVSFEKNPRGYKYGNIRPTKIILDDIEEDVRVRNPELRAKDEQKLNRAILPAMDIEKGKVKFIGTILHINSLLMKKIQEWHGRIYRALDDNNVPLWKERFTFALLMEQKRLIGPLAFQQEYMNDPSDNEFSIIKREWVQACFRSDISYEDLRSYTFTRTVGGVDFAFADLVTADKTEIITLAEKDGFWYICDIDSKRGWSALETMRYIKNDKYPAWHHNIIGLEENSIKSISKDLREYGLPLKLFWTGASDPAEKKVSSNDIDYFGKRETVGKIPFIMRLGTDFENLKFIIPYKTEKDKLISDSLLAELTSYALSDGNLVETGVHPDKPIALGYACELLRKKITKSIYFE